MKATQRQPYLTLTDIALPPPRFSLKDGQDSWGRGQWNLSLCHFCRFASWEGGDCSDSWLECHCGITKIEEQAEMTWCDSSDCWAFRPRYALVDCVDAVGLLLQGWYPDWGSLRRVYFGKESEVMPV
jgi:hypothetical protein